MACDLIIASDKARFGQPEINLGLIPGFGGTQRLPRRIGHPRARHLILTGDMIDAKTAVEWGLINQVVAPEQLIATARQVAEKIAAKSPLTVRQAKAALIAAATMTEDAGLKLEQQAFGVCFGSADRVEGTQAFVEKRDPKWQGK
jgi:enoyl-CoA hydratase